MNKENFTYEDESMIDEMINWFGDHLPKATVLNPNRYREFLAAKAAFDCILEENGNEKATVNVFPEFLAASFSAELDDLTVYNLPAMMAVMKLCSNFEVYPLTNGKICISFMFHKVFTPIA